MQTMNFWTDQPFLLHGFKQEISMGSGFKLSRNVLSAQYSMVLSDPTLQLQASPKSQPAVSVVMTSKF